MLRALRDDETCQEILCAMLELDVVESVDMQQQIITTLQSTQTGKSHYIELCQRQLHLKELVRIDVNVISIAAFMPIIMFYICMDSNICFVKI
jgi:D-mannonate dehydratase